MARLPTSVILRASLNAHLQPGVSLAVLAIISRGPGSFWELLESGPTSNRGPVNDQPTRLESLDEIKEEMHAADAQSAVEIIAVKDPGLLQGPICLEPPELYT
ncbi:uncharacterized protein BDZ83DRAFT_646807 [Colletotrichum acutatum]|uniref:Uncharacterized protein n=1 Tax=Glomerella acutata TaxID=27357 RepID=A0AAD9D1A1_GLOAC|nr:uncharacterized protein BDZ83DRAFT_646807 [Colletotrichum acutatum]KAK1730448.1 hypothetical protein BDZ83DRAFT_646807 [Colletotrichum acutatum]